MHVRTHIKYSTSAGRRFPFQKSTMRRNITSIVKLLVPCVVTILLTVFMYKTFFLVQDLYENDRNSSFQDRIRAEMRQQAGAFFSVPRNVNGKKIDWHNYRQIEEERKRMGVGENGQPAHLEPDEEAERKRIFAQNGFNGYLSDKISLNRSVADIRHKE